MLVALPALALAAMACEALVGISDLPQASDGGDANADVTPPNNYVCTNSTRLITSNGSLTTIKVGSGFVFGGGEGFGVLRCAPGNLCTGASDFVNITTGNTFEDFALAPSSLFYTLEGVSGDAGSVHSSGLDGTGDQTLLTGQNYPSWAAVSGSRTFWVEDSINGSFDVDTTPSIVHCIGCGGSDMPWITKVNATWGLIADANDVYVLADDGSAADTIGVYGCSVSSACGNSPRVVATGADYLTTESMLASDGTNVYLSRIDSTDIARIDPAGNAASLVTNATFYAIAVDAATGDLFFGTDNGVIGTVKTDGSSDITKLSSCAPSIVDALAFDATNLYVLVSDNNTNAPGVYAIARP